MSSKASIFEQLINNAVDRVSINEQPVTLFEPIGYILSLGGKRLRPLLTLLATDLFNGKPEDAIESAVAIEVFHNFTLMHDDLMDHSDMRRGSPVVHKKWNDSAAILSGDAMLIEAYRQLEKVPADKLPTVLSVFSTMALDVCRGQQYDLDFEQRIDVTEAEYLEMIRLKTGVLFAGALKIGAVLADAPVEDIASLFQFGINLGLAFQLRDDLLDVYGDPSTFGKKIGGDILCNKKTFLLISALKNANPQQLKDLNRWLAITDFASEAKIKAVRIIYNELNLKTISELLIQKYYLASLQHLSAINVPDENKKELFALSENLMYREK